MVIFVPALLLLLFGYVLSFDIRNIETCLMDFDRSAHSRAFIRSIKATEIFKVKEEVLNLQKATQNLDNGKFTVSIIIPHGFGKKLEAGDMAKVQVFIDGSNSQMASIVQAYVRGFTYNYFRKILQDKELYLSYISSGNSIPLEISPRIWFNPELKSNIFLIPGLIVFILMIICTISTALSIVREREKGTMEQLLVSPLHAWQIILGKVLPYVAIALSSTALIVIVANLAFGVKIKGNNAMFVLTTTLFILSALGQGIFISSITRSLQVAYFAAALSSILPSLLLSGFIFPIRNMPYVIQLITYIVPARYFVSILRCIMIKGVGIEAYWKQIIFLAIISLIMLAGATGKTAKAKLM